MNMTWHDPTSLDLTAQSSALSARSQLHQRRRDAFVVVIGGDGTISDDDPSQPCVQGQIRF